MLAIYTHHWLFQNSKSTIDFALSLRTQYTRQYYPNALYTQQITFSTANTKQVQNSKEHTGSLYRTEINFQQKTVTVTTCCEKRAPNRNNQKSNEKMYKLDRLNITINKQLIHSIKSFYSENWRNFVYHIVKQQKRYIDYICNENHKLSTNLIHFFCFQSNLSVLLIDMMNWLPLFTSFYA